MFPDPLDVLDHVIQGVAFRVFEAFRAARSALIDQHQLTAARHRLKRGEKVRVIRSRAAVQQQQRDTTTERLIVDAYTTAVDEAFSVARTPADVSIAHFLNTTSYDSLVVPQRDCNSPQEVLSEFRRPVVRRDRTLPS